jgi:hypothetical protein
MYADIRINVMNFMRYTHKNHYKLLISLLHKIYDSTERPHVELDVIRTHSSLFTKATLM